MKDTEWKKQTPGAAQRLTDDQLDGVVGGLMFSGFGGSDFIYTMPQVDAEQGVSLKDLTSLVNNSPTGGENE